MEAALERRKVFQAKLDASPEPSLPTEHTVSMFLESFSAVTASLADAKKGDLAQLEAAAAAASGADKADALHALGLKQVSLKTFPAALSSFLAAKAASVAAPSSLDNLEWLGLFQHLSYDMQGALKTYREALGAREATAAAEGSQRSADLEVKIAASTGC
ncbi:hypothetical protein TeGR_g13178 [Tetraparma gracilis]|uniref:Uncharacterized protein n=1 Tax=Tetraparma gracilis TaxID=2962635 RepID=A0ABQ6MX71_9STRA|nr:hypothetical protein TeGR_g13178 [Tetraparma gracilis]